jgi:hypothetical protein
MKGMDSRIRRYILSVMRNVYLKTEARRQIADDLKATMLAACEDKPVEDVIRDMGSPLQMAKELMSVHATNVEEMGVVNAMLSGATRGHFEMRSKAMIGDKPLVHVAFGYDEETGALRIAQGIIAIGTIAKGWVALGGIAIGALAFGGIAIGGVALGGLAIGLLALGGLALAAVLAAGGAALAGGLSIGGLALAVWTAVGGYARAMNYYTATGQSPPVSGWALWLANNIDSLSWLVVALAVGPTFYLMGVSLSRILGLDIRDILAER